MKEGLAETCNMTEEIRGRYYLGSIYVSESKYPEALTQFQFCETHLQDSDISHEHLMDALSYVYEKLGKPKNAARYRQAANIQRKN
jgi:phenylalanyl-tRNA synthetase alpha subunit